VHSGFHATPVSVSGGAGDARRAFDRGLYAGDGKNTTAFRRPLTSTE
jgi:hypothetical protein